LTIIFKKIRSKIFFLKNKADHFRYLQEITENNDFIEEAKKFYTEAIQLTKNLNLTDTTYLTLYLNYSVFLHDVLNERTQAINTAKQILHSALKDTDEITENHQKDIIILCQMIKDNLSLWKTEMPEELNNI
jgi:14-3-3 protein epsilon